MNFNLPHLMQQMLHFILCCDLGMHSGYASGELNLFLTSPKIQDKSPCSVSTKSPSSKAPIKCHCEASSDEPSFPFFVIEGAFVPPFQDWTRSSAKFRNFIDCLYNYYSKFGGGSCRSGVESSGKESSESCTTSIDNSYFMSIFHKYRASRGSSVEYKLEVNRYLTKEVESRGGTFDILNMWRVNSTKYPILGQIARDILAIRISIVASKSAFNIEGRILDLFRVFSFENNRDQ